jgi:hypothetical protein
MVPTLGMIWTRGRCSSRIYAPRIGSLRGNLARIQWSSESWAPRGVVMRKWISLTMGMLSTSWAHVRVTPGARERDDESMREGLQCSDHDGTRTWTHRLDQGWQQGIHRQGIAPHPRPHDEIFSPWGSPQMLAGNISSPSPFPTGINPQQGSPSPF